MARRQQGTFTGQSVAELSGHLTGSQMRMKLADR